MTPEQQKIYFAALEEPEEFAKAVFSRKLIYDHYMRDTGLFKLYSKMHWAYFGREVGSAFNTTIVGKDGPEGELHVLKVNHLRSIITGWDSILGGQRTALEPVPQDGDYESELQKKRAKALLNHYVAGSSPAKLEVIEQRVREYSCLYGASWGLQLWNHQLGPIAVPGIEALDGQPGMAQVRTGDLQAWALMPLNVAFDPWRKDADMPWYLCRVWYSKHAAVKRWPEFEEEILKSPPDNPNAEVLDFGLFTAGFSPIGRRSEDEVPLYFFCHDPNECIEDGKQAWLLNSQVVLEWDKLLYRGRDGNRRKPIERLAPADVPESAIGWTPAFDLLAPMEAADSLSTIEITNARTFGLGTMTSEKGAGVVAEQISTGLLLVEFNKGFSKPEPMKVPPTPDSVPATRKNLIAEMGMLLGVSGVNRGDASATVDKSGSALAFIDAKALQFSSKFQGNCVMWREGFYLTTITIAQVFMTLERQFEVMGQEVAALLPPFSGKQIDRITRIKVQTVNPLSQTISGRMQIAETIAERWAGSVSVGQWMRIWEDGNAEFLTRDASQAERNMDRENELLSMGIGPVPQVPVLDPRTSMPVIGPDGQPVTQEAPVPGQRYVRALITDDHEMHVLRHRAVLDNPAVREISTPEAQAIVKATLEHIDEHEKLAALLTVKRPGLMQLTRQKPLLAALPPPALPEGVQVGGAAADQRGEPAKKTEGTPEAKVEQPTPAGAGQLPRQPSLPTNPSTGRKAPGPAPRVPQPQ